MNIPEKKAIDRQQETKDKITRKQAIVKSSYIVFSAATMMMLLGNPLKAQAQSSPAPPTKW